MKYAQSLIPLLGIVFLLACAPAPVQTKASQPRGVSPVARAVSNATPVQIIASNVTEETEIKELVEGFGQRLQNVSLQGPDAAQEMQKQYSGFVSSALLDTWRSHILAAPGRIVSSPWPDRIEITSLSNAGPDRYAVTGVIIQITSTEVGSKKAAAQIPVHLAVERIQGRWLITEYTQEQ
jgi:hypothetical protein